MLLLILELVGRKEEKKKSKMRKVDLKFVIQMRIQHGDPVHDQPSYPDSALFEGISF